jgi:hypothetical protein
MSERALLLGTGGGRGGGRGGAGGGLKLRHSRLGVAFHLRDLLGGGGLLRLSTPAGPVIKAAAKGHVGR